MFLFSHRLYILTRKFVYALPPLLDWSQVSPWQYHRRHTDILRSIYKVRRKHKWSKHSISLNAPLGTDLPRFSNQTGSFRKVYHSFPSLGANRTPWTTLLRSRLQDKPSYAGARDQEAWRKVTSISQILSPNISLASNAVSAKYQTTQTKSKTCSQPWWPLIPKNNEHKWYLKWYLKSLKRLTMIFFWHC